MLTNFVIDRIRRGSMFDLETGEVMWTISQVEDPSLSITADNDEKVDAVGTRIMQFDRAKNAEFTGNNSLIDLGLAAAQFGSDPVYGSTDSKVQMPKWEEITLTAAQATAKKVTLTEAPVEGTIPYIYVLNGDKSLASKYGLATTANATSFSLTAKELTLPNATDIFKEGVTLWIPYDYMASTGMEISNSATKFPKVGRFVLEVLVHDTCRPSVDYYAYLDMPNAKLTSEVDLDFTTEGTHPFTIQAQQDYCDIEKRLFSLKVPDAV